MVIRKKLHFYISIKHLCESNDTDKTVSNNLIGFAGTNKNPRKCYFAQNTLENFKRKLGLTNATKALIY